MDHRFQGASHEGLSNAFQLQHPTQAQRTPAQSQLVASYTPAIARESEMPDEWGYPASSAPQVSNVQSYVPSVVQTGPTPRGAPQPLPSATPTPPFCRYPNCHRPVTWDKRTYEYAEYCGVEHMRDAVQRLGVPLCSACGKYPRRTNSKFCGSLCETWALQREHQMPLSQEPRGQQEHHHWHQQHQQRQHWQPPPTVGSQSNVPNAGAVTGTWSNAPRGSAPPNNGSQHNWQGRY